MNKQQLFENIKRKKSFLCVGLDTDIKKIPEHLLKEEDPIFAFNKAIIDATADLCIAYKPNLAFYESMGVKGWIAFEKTVNYIKQNYPDQFIIADAKRGDIGTTMAAYAAAWAADGPLAADAVTASPYLGFGSLQPLLDTAAAHDRGVFVLAATSNPEGAEVQRAVRADGRTVAQSVVDAAAAVNATDPGLVGVVVGATLTEVPDVSALGGPVLVPGVGAQGGRPEALAGLGDARPGQLLPAVSREVLRAGPDAAAIRAAAETLRDAVSHLL